MKRIEEMPELAPDKSLSALVTRFFNESFGKLVIDLNSETLRDFREWAREENLPVEALIRKVLLDKWRARVVATPNAPAPPKIPDVPTPALPKASPSAAPKTMLERILARQQKPASEDATPNAPAAPAPSHNNNEEA